MGSLDQEQVKRSIESKGGDDGGVAHALSDLMENLTDEEQHTLLTELSDREIKHIAVIDTVGEHDDVTQKFLESFKMHKVSKRRKGRKEVTGTAEAFAGVFEKENTSKIDKIKGTLGL